MGLRGPLGAICHARGPWLPPHLNTRCPSFNPRPRKSLALPPSPGSCGCSEGLSTWGGHLDPHPKGCHSPVPSLSPCLTMPCHSSSPWALRVRSSSSMVSGASGGLPEEGVGVEGHHPKRGGAGGGGRGAVQHPFRVSCVTHPRGKRCPGRAR